MTESTIDPIRPQISGHPSWATKAQARVLGAPMAGSSCAPAAR